MIIYINHNNGQKITLTKTKRWFWLPKTIKKEKPPMWVMKFMIFKLQIWYIK